MVRFKNRWLLLSVATTGYVTSEENKTEGPFLRKAPPLSAHTLTKALRSSLQENFGDAAAGTLGGPLTCKFYSPKTGTCIVRCARQGAELVWAAATLTTAIEGIRVRICVRHCGGKYRTSVFESLTPGTIRKVQLKAIALDRHYISQFEAAKRVNLPQDVGSKQAQGTGVDYGQPVAHPAKVSGDPDDLGVPADDIGMPVDDSDESDSEADNFEQEEVSGEPTPAHPRDRELQAQLDDSRRQIMNVTQ